MDTRNEYLAMGMNHIASAVSFLNNDAKMVRHKLKQLSALAAVKAT